MVLEMETWVEASGRLCLLSILLSVWGFRGADSGLSFPMSLPTWIQPNLSHGRLMAWLLHRLEMALPQPVLNGKAGNQVSAGPRV